MKRTKQGIVDLSGNPREPVVTYGVAPPCEHLSGWRRYEDDFVVMLHCRKCGAQREPW